MRPSITRLPDASPMLRARRLISREFSSVLAGASEPGVWDLRGRANNGLASIECPLAVASVPLLLLILMLRRLRQRVATELQILSFWGPVRVNIHTE
jgi:hypothetical protein